MVGHLVHAVIRHVGDDDAGLRGRLDVHVVHPDAKAGNDPTALELPDDIPCDGSICDEHAIRLAGDIQNRLRSWLGSQAQFSAPVGQNPLRRLQTGKDRVRYSNDWRRHASPHRFLHVLHQGKDHRPFRRDQHIFLQTNGLLQTWMPGEGLDGKVHVLFDLGRVVERIGA